MRSTKFVAPASDRLTAEQYSPSGHQFFHITEAHTEPEVEPNAVRNDLLRKPMATVRAVRHSSSMPFADKANVAIPREAFPLPFPYRSVLFDHDGKFGGDVLTFLQSSDLKPMRTSIRSPWQNGTAERWVGSARREFLDHVIPLNEDHLRRLARDYITYYHLDRTHIGLNKGTPAKRAIEARSLRRSYLISTPRLGGLHHRYSWSQEGVSNGCERCQRRYSLACVTPKRPRHYAGAISISESASQKCGQFSPQKGADHLSMTDTGPNWRKFVQKLVQNRKTPRAVSSRKGLYFNNLVWLLR